MDTIITGKLDQTPCCPQCQTELAGYTGVDGVAPKADDLTICMYCQSVLQFNADFSLRFASAEAIAEVTLQLSRMQNIARKVNAKKP